MAILLLAFLCLTSTILAEKNHLDTFEDSLEISKRPIELSDESLEISKRPIELSEESLEISKRPIELSDESLEISKRPIELSDESLEISKRPIDLFGESDERFGLPLIDAEFLPENFHPLDEDEGRNGPVCNQFGIYRVPDQTSCSRFILCNNGFASVQNCPQGFHFNVESGQCLDRSVANCDVCRFNTEPIRFLPFEGSCTRYIVCFGTTRQERECDNGLYFNPAINKCDRQENVVCLIDGGGGGGGGGGGNPWITCPNTNELHVIPSLTSCEEYYTCLRGLSERHVCAQGDIFDLNSQRCANTGRCILDVNPTCGPGARFIPHPFDCRHYFSCNNGVATIHSCRFGDLFDRFSLRCVLDREANCGNPDFGGGAIWPGNRG